MRIFGKFTGELANLQGKRNLSILEHGCNPIDKKSSKNAIKLVDQILEEIWGDEWKDYKEKLKFPVLKTELIK